MKQLKLICLVACIIGTTSTVNSQSNLTKIIENQKFGFIDSTGKVIIPAVFNYADDFSEGLAAARADGAYGYIDERGQFVIRPAFEQASAFWNGHALVYNKKEMYFINKKGKKTIRGIGIGMSKLSNGFAEISTKSGKVGLIDTSGKLVFDTIFHSIGSFRQGVAVFTRLVGPDEIKESAVLDRTGKIIVPFGAYSSIHGFRLEVGHVISKDKKWEGLIDTNGSLLFRVENTKISLFDIQDFDHIKVKRQNIINGKSINYEGFINQKGVYIVDNPTFQQVLPFSNGRAFVKDTTRKWFIIDATGRRLSQRAFDWVLDGIFVEGKTWVRSLNGTWELIDTLGNTLFVSKLKEILKIPGTNLLKYNETLYDQNSNFVKNQYGIANQYGQVLTPHIYEEIDYEGFKNGLLLAQTTGHYQYLDQSGKVKWEQAPANSSICTLNIDYSIYNHFWAASKRHPGDLGGFGKSENFPKAIHKKDHFKANQLSVSIQNNLDKTSNCPLALYISNLSGHDRYFQAQDSHLYLQLQAKNEEGEWQDINSLYESDCGNSFHTLTLPHGNYWGFSMPTFEGVFSTVLRAKLKVIDQIDEESTRMSSYIYLYSNEVKTKINPGQFWNIHQNSMLDIAHPYRN